MILHRSARPSTDYTMVSNVALRDRTLSFRARGVLAYVLSLPDGAKCNVQQLTRLSLEGRDAIRRALAELVAARYVSRVKNRDVNGTWRWEMTVFDRPQSGDNVESPGPEKPSTDNQAISNNKTSHITSDDQSCEPFTLASECIDCYGSGYIETNNKNWVRCACSGIGQQ
jgi:hypothetical protein